MPPAGSILAPRSQKGSSQIILLTGWILAPRSQEESRIILPAGRII